MQFERNGVSFQYPENWQLTPEPYESGWTVTVQSPGTAFLTLTCDGIGPGIGELADAALSALKEEYKEVDAEPFSGNIAGLPAIGYDAEFFSLDLTNTCIIRAMSAEQGTILIIAQASDLEQTNLQVLRAMIVSMRIDEE